MPTETEDSTTTVRATWMQESLWWAHQRAKNKSVYNITWRLTCDKPVDADALTIAWQALVDRHEALRTSLVREDDTAHMVVHPRVRARLRTVDLDVPESPDLDLLLGLIGEETQDQAFDLEAESLGRLTLVRGGGRHELLLTVHHLVVDGWALQLLADELSSAYADAVAGREPAFAEAPTPYRTYAAEITDESAAAAWAPSIEYWRQTLEGAAATTVTATNAVDFVPGAAGTVIRYSFGDAANEAIAALGERMYATPFAVFHAAMHIVLSRAGDLPDVTVGTVLANRMTPRDQTIVGYLTNLVISRGRMSTSDTLSDVVTRTRDGVWAMMAHQSVPYSLVYGALSAETQHALTDEVPLGLSHLGPIGSDLHLGDVRLTLQPSPNRAARGDISISTWEVAGTYHAEIEYNTGRYDRETVTTLLADLDAVIALFGTEPDRPVSSVRVRSRAAPAHVDQRGGEAAAGEFGPSTSTTWQQVSDLWARLVGAPPAGPEVNFFHVGGQSMTVLQLAGDLAAATGVTIDIVDWLGDPTPRALVALVDGETTSDGETAGTTLVHVREGAGGPHVHLLHGAGGDPNDFADIVAALPADWRITASRESEPLADVPAMAERYQADLAAENLRPDVLCGWSLGGLVGFAMAAADSTPPALALLDSPPPVSMTPDPDEELFAGFAAAFAGQAGVTPRVSGDPDFGPHALAACTAAAGHGISAGVLTDRWRTYLRHARAGEAYVGPERVPTSALVVGAGQRDIDMDEWARRMAQATRLRVEADHHGVLRSGIATQVAGALVRFVGNENVRTEGENGNG